MFLLFNPGTCATEHKRETLLQDVLELRHGGLYVRDVVNEPMKNVTDARRSAGKRRTAERTRPGSSYDPSSSGRAAV